MPSSSHSSNQLPAAAPDLQPHTFRRILVATDFGEGAEGALRIAQARAGYTGAEVAGVHVCEENDDCEARRRELDERVRGVAGDDSLAVQIFVETGDLAKAVAHRAEEWGADLIIVSGTKADEGVVSRWFRHDTVADILRHAPCAVLVSRNTPATCRIVVGTDFSDPSMPAVCAAAAEQTRTGGQVTLVHCIYPAWSSVAGDVSMGAPLGIPVSQEDLADAFRPRLIAAAVACNLTADVQVLFAEPAEGLAHLATEISADLVIVGTHGRTGFRRMILGSVAEKVAHKAPCAVLVVRQHGK
jgi:nucleotide-binding universal stress UspA family protein